MGEADDFEVVWPLTKDHYLCIPAEAQQMSVLEEFEETALIGCKAVREFLTYRGNNKEYLNRAKVGAVSMGSYSRLRATLANERQIRLMEGKANAIDITPAKRAQLGD